MFRDRTDAGRRLAHLVDHRGLVRPIVLGLPRGGVVVASEVAAAIGADLDILVARKIGAPGRPELGVGAIAEGGGRVVDRAALQALHITIDEFEAGVRAEDEELQRRVRLYRGDAGLPPLDGRDVIVVDDGLATGVTAEAALRSLDRFGTRSVTLAVPVCAPSTASRLRKSVSALVCALAPPDFFAVGVWYEDFRQTSDDEVRELLARAAGGAHRAAG